MPGAQLHEKILSLLSCNINHQKNSVRTDGNSQEQARGLAHGVLLGLDSWETDCSPMQYS